MIWLGSAVALVLLWVLAWNGAGWVGAKGDDVMVIRALFAAVSAIVVGGIAWYLLSQSPAPPPVPAAGDEVAAVLSVAEQQLRKAGVAGRRGLSELPLVIVLGRPGSAKSTSLARAGIELDLLAGDLYRGDDKVPLATQTVNVWYSRGAGIVEVGWPIVSDGTKWQRLLERLQPKRLAAAVSGGKQAPRVAVVCVSAEELAAPDARERVQAMVRELRGPVAALAEAFGVALPVYVLVTKGDRISGFPEFVRPFTPDEARDVVGATFAVEQPEMGGAWGERAANRIDGALTMLFEGFVARRLTVLDRHPAAEQKPLAYEFPREWRKLSPALSQFLVELTRPNQLKVNPFLRGVYLTGIRPIANEGQATPTPVLSTPAAASATAIFTDGPPRRPAAPVNAAARPRAQWAFLERLLGEVILSDEVAFGVTRTGTRLDGLRRALIGVGTIALLALGVAIAASWRNNRELVEAVRHHTAALAAMPNDARGTPSLAVIQQLDSLRVVTDTLGRWTRDGAPLNHRFGLFIGPTLHPVARRAYFAELRTRLYDAARLSTNERLRAVSGAPRDGFEFDSTYGWLKAHLVTTSHPDKSTGTFLGPVLVRRWASGRGIDAPRMALAQQQFEFLGDELPRGNPYSDPADGAQIARARQFLLNSHPANRIYQFIVAEASRVARPVSFASAHPQLTGFLTDPYEVPAAFTKPGRIFVEEALRNIDRYLMAEGWVLGDNAVEVGDKALLVDSLRARWRRDAAVHWRGYVRAASVTSFGLNNAMSRLQALAGNQSAIVAALALAARNTAGDTAYLEKTFQAVRAVVTTDSLRPSAEGSKEYLSALARLGSDIDAVAKAIGPEQVGAAKNAVGSVSAAKLAVTALSQQMQVDPEGSVDRDVRRLLLQPIENAERLLDGAGTGPLNGGGASFCSAFDPVSRKFPLSPFATAEATVQELNDLLKPGSGKLWKFYEEKLAAVIQRGPDGTFSAIPGGALQINPAFTSFLTRAARLSEGLYANGASEPRIELSLSPNFTRAMPQLSFGLNGQMQRFNAASALSGASDFTWSLGAAREARLTAAVGTTPIDVVGRGPWGLLRVFFTATTWAGRGGKTVAEWTATPEGTTLPEPLRIELSLSDAPNVLRRDFYTAGFSCQRAVVLVR
jgi:type VI secretion system protein ImpL